MASDKRATGATASDKWQKLCETPQPDVNPAYRVISVSELRRLVKQRDTAVRERQRARDTIRDIKAALGHRY